MDVQKVEHQLPADGGYVMLRRSLRKWRVESVDEGRTSIALQNLAELWRTIGSLLQALSRETAAAHGSRSASEMSYLMLDRTDISAASSRCRVVSEKYDGLWTYC